MSFRIIQQIKTGWAISLLLLNTYNSVAQKIDANNLKNGDLLFQNLDCGEMCDAIEAVTRGWKHHSFSHMGMVEKQNDTVYVWESMQTGVRKVLLSSFRQRSSHPLLAGRLKKKYQPLIVQAIRFVQQNTQVAYDPYFLPDNGKYYCSELIYDAFRYANGNSPFFKLYPMTFKQPGSDTFFSVWVHYFEGLEVPIPEGVPGCSPGGVSRCKKLHMVGWY